MSLVSVSNFTAPFKHRVHLITILLVTIVFATLRLSGASVEVRNTSETKRPQAGAAESARTNGIASDANSTPQRNANEEMIRALRAQRAEEMKRQEAALKLNPRSEGELIEDVMRPVAPPPARNKAVEQRNNDAIDGGSLSDIEKQLGLK